MSIQAPLRTWLYLFFSLFLLFYANKETFPTTHYNAQHYSAYHESSEVYGYTHEQPQSVLLLLILTNPVFITHERFLNTNDLFKSLALLIHLLLLQRMLHPIRCKAIFLISRPPMYKTI
ncbi:hypothetical protein GCM10011391_39120 [Pullulanibacillus camelliae]|uniref:Uncharacterized protein n=1 Tax=Pullulanibacillus camelliae TaxID=1707096 RepID=A0A8J2YNG1_9BACL|nr:hypothetical protein [Pullulanibacillus camelliae]GGE56314.1 hypothetical protein GCM10011391_39120 [Pullulanibacillus camelliae]